MQVDGGTHQLGDVDSAVEAVSFQSDVLGTDAQNDILLSDLISSQLSLLVVGQNGGLASQLNSVLAINLNQLGIVAGFIGTPQMNFFNDAKLVKVDGKYAVELGGKIVDLSEEKQAKLAANNVEPQDIVLGVRPEHIELAQAGIGGKVDVSEMMGSSVHLHVSALGPDVVLVVSTMNMTGAEVAALANGNPVTFNFAGHVCHVFSKETGINLEA